jgi:redox-sensing transcriptional repressor
MNPDQIPDIIISRLPVYLRGLQRLADQGAETTSSQELGEKVSISAAQIRKDLSQFGEFGKQGTGYHIPFLIGKLQGILHVDRIWDVAIIGMGDMGHALARYQGFTDRGFHVVMTFDNNPQLIGSKVGSFVIRDAQDIVPEIRNASIKIAMLTVPAKAAQAVTDKLLEAGVKAILNYAPISLSVPDGVHVQYIDSAIGLQRMAYYLV